MSGLFEHVDELAQKVEEHTQLLPPPAQGQSTSRGADFDNWRAGKSQGPGFGKVRATVSNPVYQQASSCYMVGHTGGKEECNLITLKNFVPAHLKKP